MEADTDPDQYLQVPQRCAVEGEDRVVWECADDRFDIYNWIAPRIMHYISFAFHFICITFHLHLKIMPRQHEMHDTSLFKCHALHLHFMK